MTDERKARRPRPRPRPVSKQDDKPQVAMVSQIVLEAWTDPWLQLCRKTVGAELDDMEFAQFMTEAYRRRLDPLNRQIHPVKRKRWMSARRPGEDGHYEDYMVIQTGIDGYRLIADRTGRYAPGKAAVYTYDPKGNVTSATSYVMKLAGGTWHEVSATAFMDEYKQEYREIREVNGEKIEVKTLADMWRRMPRNQLAKCAESLALRRAFPEDLAGLFTDEEMSQADTIEAPYVLREQATQVATHAAEAKSVSEDVAAVAGAVAEAASHAAKQVVDTQAAQAVVAEAAQAVEQVIRAAEAVSPQEAQQSPVEAPTGPTLPEGANEGPGGPVDEPQAPALTLDEAMAVWRQFANRAAKVRELSAIMREHGSAAVKGAQTSQDVMPHITALQNALKGIEAKGR